MLEEILLANSCITIIKEIGQRIRQMKSGRLSKEEKDLLTAAASKGQFRVWRVGQVRGEWISADRKHFNKQEDPAHDARYREAFKSLCERGYVTHLRGETFMLSGSGFDKARKLKQGATKKDDK